MDDDEVNPEIKRALGAADARVDKAVDRISRPGTRARKPAPKEHPTGDMTFDDDTLNRIVDGVAKRQKQQSAPEIHIHQHSQPDSDAPDSDESALSVHVAGQRVAARGVIAWGVLVVAGLLGAMWLGRMTAPHAPRGTVTAPQN